MQHEYELIILLSKPYLNDIENERITNLVNSVLDWELIFENLERHRIVAIAFYHLKNNNLCSFIPTDILKKLEEIFEYNIDQQQLFLNELKPVLIELQQKELSFCILKGMVVQKLLYPEYTRIYSDIDMLIEKNDYPEFLNILNKYGFSNCYNSSKIKNKREHLFLMMNTYEFPEFKKVIKGKIPNEVYVDLQHTHTLDTKMGYTIDTGEELGCAEKTIIGDMLIPHQRIDYLLLHLCTHMFGDCTTISEIILGKAFRLRNFADIFVLVEKNVNVYLKEDFYKLLKDTNTARPVYFCLFLCMQIYSVSKQFKKIIINIEKMINDHLIINQYGFENGLTKVYTWKCTLQDRLFSDMGICEVKENCKDSIDKYAKYDTRIN